MTCVVGVKGRGEWDYGRIEYIYVRHTIASLLNVTYVN